MNKSITHQKKYKFLFLILLIFCLSYTINRIYFRITDGFLISNISSSLSFDSSRETRPITEKEQELIHNILTQSFTYLGKGCQSYVFLSEDKQYVLKFFKYQRFTPQPWLYLLNVFPKGKTYFEKKVSAKNKKLQELFNSWKIAFDHLQAETGLIYVHLNKGHNLKNSLIIKDKVGFTHTLNPNEYEFLIQHKATLYCTYIKNLIKKNKTEEAKKILLKSISLIINEYKRGFADNDHAFMQNTGILKGNPIHIDIGQFVYKEKAKKEEVYKQDLFSKMFKFRQWLKQESLSLSQFFDAELENAIGPEFHEMKPIFLPHGQKEFD